MDQLPPSHDAYFHVRIIIGIVVGLSISRLLTGLARFVQHPSGDKIYPVHLGWALFVFLLIIHFWWFEFRLAEVPQWFFEFYLFVIFYACLLFLSSALLFPDKMDEYAGYRDYFMSRRAWFFGLLALIFLVDLADTSLKGGAYFHSFGLEYPLRNLGYAAAFAAAAIIRNPRFHVVFVVAALAYQASWILRLFDTL
ncbi:hypothetical protein [Hansschlegelia plantiphila]|uniref:Mll4938 protein n=1 Tax=Hansschlegelia plantiphila TaxID=374655 RepID=A0A9W6J2Q2_9HYPH|nr:hypothetical protein [Hansschlegelia plantiphila]GLK68643.1 hypothetical protein GCM10008179_22810 [Hansschlegelia plantiphila]